MSSRKTIMSRFLAREDYDPEKIADEIDAWHDSDSALPLHEWLGLTSEEYGRFVMDSGAISMILAEHLKREAMAVCAKSRTSVEFQRADGEIVITVRLNGKKARAGRTKKIAPSPSTSYLGLSPSGVDELSRWLDRLEPVAAGDRR